MEENRVKVHTRLIQARVGWKKKIFKGLSKVNPSNCRMKEKGFKGLSKVNLSKCKMEEKYYRGLSKVILCRTISRKITLPYFPFIFPIY